MSCVSLSSSCWILFFMTLPLTKKRPGRVTSGRKKAIIFLNYGLLTAWKDISAATRASSSCYSI